jgi:hypothetical protein
MNDPWGVNNLLPVINYDDILTENCIENKDPITLQNFSELSYMNPDEMIIRLPVVTRDNRIIYHCFILDSLITYIRDLINRNQPLRHPITRELFTQEQLEYINYIYVNRQAIWEQENLPLLNALNLEQLDSEIHFGFKSKAKKSKSKPKKK